MENDHCWKSQAVLDLQREGHLLVEDGNHGEHRPRKEEFTSEGTSFIRAADMDAGRVMFERASRINKAALQRIRKGIGKPGDVLLSHKGTVGKVAWARPGCEPFVCSPQTTFWRAAEDGGLVPRFLLYQLQSRFFQEQLRAFQGDTDMAPYVSLTNQRKLNVLVPPLPEQRRIALVLGALDDKIELNRKMNRTLEDMAQALFESWFLDFDGIDELVDSEQGPIPQGWVIKPLDGVASFLNGTACQKYPATEGEPWLPVIKIRELNQGVTNRSDKATAEIPEKWLVRNGDVLFSWSGTLVVKIWTGGEGVLNQHLFKVTSKSYPRWLFLLWLQRHLAQFRRAAADKATTMGHIKRHHLSDAKCAVPADGEVKSFGAVLEPLVDRQVANELQSSTLAQLRDTLLPKLISGEIRMPEAEQIVEAAL